MRVIPSFLLVSGLGLLGFAACSSADEREEFGKDDAGNGTSSGVTPNPDGGGIGPTPDSGPGPFTGDPKTCEQAAASASNVGCDYWPTITPNSVQSVFDFAVVVSNGGDEVAHITVTGPNGTNEEIDVEPSSLGTVYLPWVNELKGPETTASLAASTLQRGAAFHLVSDHPVVVYQFNPLQFEGKGGPPGKSWASCERADFSDACYSYSNDASLLLPSTAMTGTYRVMGVYGFSAHPRNAITGEVMTNQPLTHVNGAFTTITATADGTEVSVAAGSKGKILAGNGIAATDNGGTLTLNMNAGDVALLINDKGESFDPSGSLIRANNPVQVISGNPCIFLPQDVQACDHVEETVFPAETLGNNYVVARPSAPEGGTFRHKVRLYGNVDGTTLTYAPSKPADCPTTLSAGETADCGVVDADFQVQGDHEFGVGMFLLGGEIVDPDVDDFEYPQGDPSQSFAVTVPQYRSRYVFLAPKDYITNYAIITAPANTTLTLDGDDVSDELSAISGTDFQVARIRLSNTNDGSHILETSAPVGMQVMGYGDNTSYQYPGGLNLGKIAPVPVN